MRFFLVNFKHCHPFLDYFLKGHQNAADDMALRYAGASSLLVTLHVVL